MQSVICHKLRKICFKAKRLMTSLPGLIGNNGLRFVRHDAFLSEVIPISLIKVKHFGKNKKKSLGTTWFNIYPKQTKFYS